MAGSLSVRQKNAEAARQRRIDALKVERRRANEAATSNAGALGSGIASIPKRVVNYIKSSSPSSVARDVKGIARSTYEAATEDPNAFIEDAVFSPLAAIRDFGDVRETARKLRAQGRDAEAEKMEAMAGTAVLSAVPILGRPAGVATRKAIKAAEKTAIKGAKKGAFDLRSKGYNTAKVGDTTVEYAVGPSGVEVSKVFTPPKARGQGSARAAMQSLVEAADREGLQLNLTPDPLDAATSKTKLQGFYSSLGFTPNKGRNKDFSTRAAMLRTPKVAPTVKSIVTPPEPTGIIAYHGSPHSFDRFDISKIGTGEGAQAYGRGLYFAEAEPVAQEYRQRLAEVTAAPFDRIGIPPKEWNAATMFARQMDPSQPDVAARDFAQWVGRDVTPELIDAFRVAKNPGSMYEVRINADPNQLLNWDQPIIAQSPEVQQAALLAARNANISHLGSGHRARVKLERFMDAAEQAHDPLKGSELMMAVDRDPGNNFTPETSELLRTYGIPGVKYLDQASRTAGEGTRNYVVFDDALIDLLRKYAMGGKVAAC